METLLPFIVVGISVGAVYVAKSRVLARLKELIQAVDEGADLSLQSH